MRTFAENYHKTNDNLLMLAVSQNYGKLISFLLHLNDIRNENDNKYLFHINKNNENILDFIGLNNNNSF